MQCIAFDSHKHYTWALVQDEAGKVLREQRINHTRERFEASWRHSSLELQSRWRRSATGTGSPTRSRQRGWFRCWSMRDGRG